MIAYLNQTATASTLAPFIEFSEDLTSLTAKGQAGRPVRRGEEAVHQVHPPRRLHRRPFLGSRSGVVRANTDMLAQISWSNIHTAFVPIDQQTVLVAFSVKRQQFEGNSPLEPDHSLKIIASPGIRREAELIANEI